MRVSPEMKALCKRREIAGCVLHAPQRARDAKAEQAVLRALIKRKPGLKASLQKKLRQAIDDEDFWSGTRCITWLCAKHEMTYLGLLQYLQANRTIPVSREFVEQLNQLLKSGS